MRTYVRALHRAPVQDSRRDRQGRHRGPAGGPQRHPVGARTVRCVPRERFERLPALPTLRSNDAYEELTFAPGLFGAYAPGEYDVTCTCAYPFTNWVLRAPGAVAWVSGVTW